MYVLTPQELYARRVLQLQRELRNGLITWAQYVALKRACLRQRQYATRTR